MYVVYACASTWIQINNWVGASVCVTEIHKTQNRSLICIPECACPCMWEDMHGKTDNIRIIHSLGHQSTSSHKPVSKSFFVCVQYRQICAILVNSINPFTDSLMGLIVDETNRYDEQSLWGTEKVSRYGLWPMLWSGMCVTSQGSCVREKGLGEVILTLAESIKGRHQHPYLILSTSLHSKVFEDSTHACGTIISKSILLRSVMRLDCGQPSFHQCGNNCLEGQQGGKHSVNTS